MLEMIEVPMEDVNVAELYMRCSRCGLMGIDPGLRK